MSEPIIDLNLALEYECKELIADFKQLRIEHESLKEEYAIVIRTVIKTLQAVGIWPISDEKVNIAKIMKSVSALAMDSMLPGSNIKERFSFIKDIVPIAEKYKDIDVNTL